MNYFKYMNKKLSIFNGVAFIATIVMNYLSNTGVFNGNDNKSVSDEYFNLFTPAGYAFSIWSIIYLGLLGFVFYTGRGLFKKDVDHTLLSKIGWWFVISCVANSIWIVFWLYELPGIAALIMMVILFSLIKIILNIKAGATKFLFKEYIFVALPFTLYLGWISVALVANMAAFLTNIGWSGWGLTEVTWAIIMIIVAGLINLFMVWNKNLTAYGLVGIWAVLAISVSNTRNGESISIVYTCYAVSAILFLAIIINLFKKRQLIS